MNYERLMSYDPTELGVMTNSKGQNITFVEHPTRGDEWPIIAICQKMKRAATTDFFDLEDMVAGHGEYEPWFNENGELVIG